MNVDEFMAATAPARTGKRSPLWQHSEAIGALKSKGYTYAQIREYLAQQGITVSAVRLCQFVRTKLNITTYNTAGTTAVQHPKPRATPAGHAAPPVAPKRSSASSEITPEEMAEFLQLANHTKDRS